MDPRENIPRPGSERLRIKQFFISNKNKHLSFKCGLFSVLFMSVLPPHPPIQSVLTLTQQWGLQGKMILRVINQLLVGPPVADRSKGDDLDKKGYRGPPVWGLGVGQRTPPHKTSLQNLPKKSQSPPGALVQLLLKMMSAAFTVSFQCLWPHGHHLRQVLKYLQKNVQEIARCQKILSPTV